MVSRLLISFLAGLVGFLSPCVLPLLPGYVGYMTGAGVGERVPVRRALPGTLAFVGGLSFVFVSLGAAASTLSQILHDHQRQLELASGAFIVVMGAFMLLSPRIPALLRERRFNVRPGVGPGRAFLLGSAFAFGWTPCIGPTLGVAINLAATADGLARGIQLLAAYSLGLGLPFVLAGLGLLRVGGRLKRHAANIQTAGGALLVVIGVLILSGRLTILSVWMQKVFTRLNLDLWNI